jgi:general secretion pathway protein G
VGLGVGGAAQMTAMRKGRSKARGFTLLELAVVVSIVGILAATLITRLDKTAEFAEKTAMEYTANVLNEALLLEFAHRVMDNSRNQIPAMIVTNPMDWLARKPTNYLGEFRVPIIDSDRTGNWYYDVYAHELIYLVRRGDYFTPDSAGLKRVRYMVEILYDQTDHRTMVGVSLTPVEPYKWF